jgi:plasmid maintenance system antidote protein VapI
MQIDGFCVGEYVNDFMEALGMSNNDAAELLNDNYVLDVTWIEMIRCVPLWENNNVTLSLQEAAKLNRLFGLSVECWINLDRAWKAAKASAVLSESKEVSK